MSIRGWILLFITLLDSFVTGCGINAGLLKELNPIMSWFIERVGIFMFIMFRAMFVMLVIAHFDRKASQSEAGKQIAIYCYNIAILAYTGVFVVPWIVVNAHHIIKIP